METMLLESSALQLIVLNYCKQNIDMQRFTAILA
jgi:hypothetical protein